MGGFLALVLIVVGPVVAMDQYHKGNIPAVQDACPAGIVQSATGSYHRRYVGFDGSCNYSESLSHDKL
jgi:hypothetical protein